MMQPLPCLNPLQESDFPAVRELGVRIWRQHYIPLLGAEQIEYMLHGRYSTEDLKEYLDRNDRWFWVLHCGSELIGFVRYAKLSTNVSKLEELYVDALQRGKGYGALMMRQLESHTLALGCHTLTLNVNKRNTKSISIYEKLGFAITEATTKDIGNGFVMDDFVMKKYLSSIPS